MGGMAMSGEARGEAWLGVSRGRKGTESSSAARYRGPTRRGAVYATPTSVGRPAASGSGVAESRLRASLPGLAWLVDEVRIR